jgi:hypothetical protein
MSSHVGRIDARRRRKGRVHWRTFAGDGGGDPDNMNRLERVLSSEVACTAPLAWGSGPRTVGMRHMRSITDNHDVKATSSRARWD